MPKHKCRARPSSDPTTPTIVSSLLDARFEGAAAVVVRGTLAYVAAIDADALTIVDVTDPARPEIVNAVTTGDGYESATADMRDVVLLGDYAYVVGRANARFTVIDVANASTASVVASIADRVQLLGARALAVVGRHAYVAAYDSDRLTVVDLQSGLPPASSPAAPTAVAGTPGAAQVSLVWTAPSSDGGAAITDYRIEFSANAGGSWTTFADGTSTTTATTVTGLVNGTAYIFRVSAVNAAGTGLPSAKSAAVTPFLFAPMTGVTIGTVEFGTTELGYAFRQSGVVWQVTYSGRNTSATYPGNGWTMRGVWVDGTGYKAFMRSTRNTFAVWTLSSTGVHVTSQPQTAKQVSQLETQLSFDLDQNGTIG